MIQAAIATTTAPASRQSLLRRLWDHVTQDGAPAQVDEARALRLDELTEVALILRRAEYVEREHRGWDDLYLGRTAEHALIDPLRALLPLDGAWRRPDRLLLDTAIHELEPLMSFGDTLYSAEDREIADQGLDEAIRALRSILNRHGAGL